MIVPVLGLSLRSGPTPVGRRLGLFLAALMAAGSLSPASALAQAPADPAGSGWFDPPPTPEPPPQPYYTDPRVDPPAPPEPEVADTDASALTTFKPALDPYGRWVNDSKYGTVWVPHTEAVGADFAPYVSRGRWALTADDDWIWVSDYPFGWAVFHYGRWVWISGHGWSWVPGRTYANAWVVWRVPTAGYSYVGWAPMPPTWVWMGGSAVSLWYSPPVPYVFCPSAYVFNHHVHHHIVHDRHVVHRIARHTYVHPTPYRAPAAPRVHRPAAPGVRTAIAPSTPPRGPRLATAGVPARAVPVQRAAPPPNAARLAGPRRAASAIDVPRERARAVDRRAIDQRSPLVPSAARPERVERSTPAPRVDPRPAPARRAEPTRAERPSAAPARLRPEVRSDSSPRMRAPAPARDIVRTPPPPNRTRRP